MTREEALREAGILITMSESVEPIQRAKDLVNIHTTVGWARGRLSILRDMLRESESPTIKQYVAGEIDKVLKGMRTMQMVEDDRRHTADKGGER